jgi:hypothetical protein
MKKVDGILRDMVILTLRTDLSRIQRTNLETCVTVHMHQKESTEDLLKKKVKDPTDFEWLKQVGEQPAGSPSAALRYSPEAAAARAPPNTSKAVLFMP